MSAWSLDWLNSSEKDGIKDSFLEARMDYSFGGGEEYSDSWLELSRPALARTRSWSNYSMPRSHTSPGIALWCQGIARFVTERKTQISQTYGRVSAGCSPAPACKCRRAPRPSSALNLPDFEILSIS